MRFKRTLRQMAGLAPAPYDRAMKRYERKVRRLERDLAGEAVLLEVIARRQRGEEGTAPMPFRQMRADLEKMAKGQL